MIKKKIAILGSTGSIGKSALQIFQANKNNFDIILLSANSTIVGNIKIGDNAKIGAGSVVIDDIPKDCTAVGVPAKIINN